MLPCAALPVLSRRWRRRRGAPAPVAGNATGGNSRGLLGRRGPGLRPGCPRWPGRLPVPCCRGKGGSRGLGGGSSRADGHHGPRCRAACSAPSQERLLSSKRTRLQQGPRRGPSWRSDSFQVCVAGCAGCGCGPFLRPGALARRVRVRPLQTLAGRVAGFPDAALNATSPLCCRRIGRTYFVLVLISCYNIKDAIK